MTDLKPVVSSLRHIPKPGYGLAPRSHTFSSTGGSVSALPVSLAPRHNRRPKKKTKKNFSCTVVADFYKYKVKRKKKNEWKKYICCRDNDTRFNYRSFIRWLITNVHVSVVSKIYAFLSSRVIIRSVGWETRRTALISHLANQIVSNPERKLITHNIHTYGYLAITFHSCSISNFFVYASFFYFFFF